MKKFRTMLLILLAFLIFSPSNIYAKDLPAMKTNQSMSLDGKEVEANAFLIEGNNYFKLRDMAALLTNTPAKFNVSYDQEKNSVVIESNKAYQVLNNDLVPIEVKSAKAIASSQSIILDGQEIDLTVYLINDNNYFKLRDLGKALNFGVDYNVEKEEIVVNSNEEYKEAEAEKEVVKEEPKAEVETNKAAITYSNEKAAGLSLNVLTVPNASNIGFRVVRANDSLHGTEAFSSIISRYNPKAAVNGNYFDAYNTLEPYSTIISNYEVLKLVGNDAGFYVTESGRRGVIANSSLLINGTTSAGKSFSVWYKNTPANDSTGIYIFSPYYGPSVDVKGGNAVVVKDGVISSVGPVDGKVLIPSNGYIIYLGPDAVGDGYIDRMFQTGLAITTEVAFKEPELDGQRVKEMICAGPILLKDGVDVSAANKGGYESKISTQNAQRSAIGVKEDGSVVIVTTKATIADLAKAMKALGCVSATNLDGGASSALYFNGKTITNPGRKLSTLLFIYEN
ncbi:MAG: phosphodiester glycosidase family protein [Bacillota bacterium]|nr:phosphodiester glycosidase family protein [Bacillota bacterium]